MLLPQCKASGAHLAGLLQLLLQLLVQRLPHVQVLLQRGLRHRHVGAQPTRPGERRPLPLHRVVALLHQLRVAEPLRLRVGRVSVPVRLRALHLPLRLLRARTASAGPQRREMNRRAQPAARIAHGWASRPRRCARVRQ